MNDSERGLLEKALKGGRIVEVISKWSNSIQYGVVIGDIISYIYPGGYDNIDCFIDNIDEENYYINRVLELKHGATIYVNMGKSFELYEDDYNVVYTREKRLTLKDIDYDIEYFMVGNGRTGYIVKCNFDGVDYIITRTDKLSEYISIETLEILEKVVNNYTIYEREEDYRTNFDEDDNFEDYNEDEGCPY
ncbi:MAG: hypothetical protein ACI3T9_06125 [Romboutsia timonensis]